MTTLAQGTSAAVVIGPVLNVSGSVMVDLAIANTAIVLIKYASVSAARNATTSAASVGPGMYRIVLNATDTDTMGEMALLVSGSAALPFVKYIEIWQSPTHALFYGSADQVLGSAAASALISVGVNTALVNRQVPTSAAVSGIVIQALTDYDAPSSADVSAIVQAVAMTSGSVSTLIQNALVNYDVATSADVSVLVSVGVHRALQNIRLDQLISDSASVALIHNNSIIGMIFASVSANAYDRTTDSLAAISDAEAATSAVVSGVLNSYNVASAGEVASAGINSAGISAIVQGALTNYDVPTSADVSVIVAANAGAGINSAQASTIMVQVLTDYDAPTSADISAIGVLVLTNYDVPTSADISAIGSVVAARAIASARVNVGFVNNVSVGGVGTTANPWGPT